MLEAIVFSTEAHNDSSQVRLRDSGLAQKPIITKHYVTSLENSPNQVLSTSWVEQETEFVPNSKHDHVDKIS